MMSVTVLWAVALAQTTTYDYTNPSGWYTSSPECNNNLQSPIDLNAAGSEAVGPAFLKLWVPRRPVANVTSVAANGPSLVVDMSQRGVTLTGEGFWSQYTLHEMRFHTPSEHTLEQQRYPLERQLVFKPSDLAQLVGAQAQRHSVIVISQLYAVDESRPDPMITALSDAGFGGVLQGGQGGVVGTTAGVINSLTNFKPAFGTFMNDEFYVYPGSLTTPPCSEVVTWHVSSKVHTVTTPQRNLVQAAVQSLTGVDVGGHPLPKEPSFPTSTGNARSLQDTNNRTIKKQKFYSLD